MAETGKLTMYRITLKCHGVPAGEGAQAAKDIENEFGTRTQHVDAHCWWDGTSLFITVWNDFDHTGLALRDEFRDAISACMRTPFGGDIETIEVLSMK